MRRFLLLGMLAGAVLVGTPNGAHAQESGLIEVGQMAPDISLPGATRYGVLEDDIRLSDYLGDTVVLAFFFRVRTRG